MFFPLYLTYYFTVMFWETVVPEIGSFFSGIWEAFQNFTKFLVDLGILFYVFSYLIFLGIITLVVLAIFDLIVKSIIIVVILELATGVVTDSLAFADDTSQEAS